MTDLDRAQAEMASERPSWLALIENRIEEQRGEISPESPFYEIVRDLLLATDDDASAVSQAVTKFYHLYLAEGHEKNKKLEDYSAGHYLNSISNVVFEVAPEVWFTSVEHDKLAKFLIGIKNGAADKYNKDDPQFVYVCWGLEAAAEQSWTAGHVDYYTGKHSDEPEHVWAGAWFSTAALIAKVFQGGCLEDDGHRWIAGDFKRTFELPTSGDMKTDAGRQAQVLATVNHIILAGERFVKGAKNPSPKWNFELNATKWKLWASKVKEAADTVDENARWDLRERAQKAYNKMVELYPEALESE